MLRLKVSLQKKADGDYELVLLDDPDLSKYEYYLPMCKEIVELLGLTLGQYRITMERM